mmetsp:Transcript_2029/g.3076  ORF Transcript_2029/g.3076 Transcript_2029/m.3076 type:complete len:296 (-) Transcript_2029:114-1001(-)
MGTSFSNEFTRSKASLTMTSTEMSVFPKSPCFNSCPRFYTMLRLTAALFWTGVCLWSLAAEKSINWFFALTHWQLMSLTAFFWVSTIVTYKYNGKFGYAAADGTNEDSKINDRGKARVPGLIKVNWVLLNLAYSLTFFVFVLYWTLVHDHGGSEEPDGEPCEEGDTECQPAAKNEEGEGMLANVLVHGIPFVASLLDVLLSGMPFRIMHVWHVEYFLCVYFSFTYIYSGITGHGVYEIINYAAYPEMILLPPFVLLTFVPISQIILWFFWKCARDCSGIYDRYEDGSFRSVDVDL